MEPRLALVSSAGVALTCARVTAGRRYFASIWNVFDVINIILLIVLAIMRLLT